MKRIESLLLALGLLLVASATAVAQSPWLGSDRTARVALELYRPGFDQQAEFRSLSSVLFVSGRLRASERVAVIGELPVAFGGLRLADASAQVGNPYVGLELGRPNQPVWLELGGRVPLVGSDPNSAVIVGTFADVDRFSSFLAEGAALSGALNVGARAASGLGFRVRAGPELLIPTRSGPDSETLVYYGAEISHVRGPLELSAHAGGLWIATESGNFGERSMHQAGAGFSYALGSVRPGLTLRLPLDKDLTEMLDYVVGFTLQVPLR